LDENDIFGLWGVSEKKAFDNFDAFDVKVCSNQGPQTDGAVEPAAGKAGDAE
jgi:hypothetical protein